MRDWTFPLSDSAALVDADQGLTVSYAELPGALDRIAQRLERWLPGAPHFLLARNSMDHALTVLSAFRGKIPLALVDPELAPERLADLAGIYRPASLIGDRSLLETCALPGYSFHSDDEAGLCQLVRDAGEPAPESHPDLACLLSTSGSTGTPKFVRLSSANLISNARAIAEVLEIGPGVRSLGHLKLHYSFGLSVLTSHLLSGGTVVLTGATIAERGFWEAMRDHEVAVLPCVPFHCEYIHRLGIKRLRLGSFQHGHPGWRPLPSGHSVRSQHPAAGARRPFLRHVWPDRGLAADHDASRAGACRPSGVCRSGPARRTHRDTGWQWPGAARWSNRRDRLLWTERHDGLRLVGRGPDVGGCHGRLFENRGSGLSQRGRLSDHHRTRGPFLPRCMASASACTMWRHSPRAGSIRNASPWRARIKCAFSSNAPRVEPLPRCPSRLNWLSAGSSGCQMAASRFTRSTRCRARRMGNPTMSSSPASEKFQALNEAPQWSIPQADREATLFSGLAELVDHHLQHCPAYARVLDGLWKGSPQQKLEDIPYLPVSLFKTHLLQSVPQDQVRIMMTSSGTTGAAVSRIAVDNETSRRQKLSLHASMAAILGKKRRPMLVIDSLAVVSDPALMSARGAGVLGMMPFGRDHCFALDETMNYRLDQVREWLARHNGEEIFIFGFTFLVWQYLRGLAEELGSDLSKATLVHSGGWKKLQSEAVSPEVFRRTFRELAGLAQQLQFLRHGGANGRALH
jgi:hypothetical protein